MANSITGNPIIVDTPGAGVIVSTQFLVQAIVWDQGASGANTDVVTVKDKHGVVKFSQTILTGNLVPAAVSFEMPVLFDGLIVSALSHGTLYIYLAQKNNLQA